MDKDYKIDYCYHTHTARCGHAFGQDEDFVKRAIMCSMKELAFTDHVPFPDYSQPGVRMEFSQLEEYLASIRALKKKYAGIINIYVGFEAEYMPRYLSYYRSLFSTYHIDLLILGQHGRIVDGKFHYYVEKIHDISVIQEYINTCKEGLNTGLFSYFAHPDIFVNNYQDDDDRFACWSKDLISCSVKNHVPLEINGGGLSPLNSFNRGIATHYPYLPFFKIASQIEGNQVLIGYDAHSIDKLGGPKDVTETCLNIAYQSKANIINRLTMKDIH